MAIDNVIGTRAQIRTEMKQFLKLPCLPVAPREHENGSDARIRTESNWFLRPACLPITPRRRIPDRTRTYVNEFRKLAPDPPGYGDKIIS